jgi:hypothetical protein
MNNDEKRKTTYLSFFYTSSFLYFFFSNVDKPNGNVLTFTHRRPNQATAISFSIIAQAKTNGME